MLFIWIIIAVFSWILLQQLLELQLQQQEGFKKLKKVGKSIGKVTKSATKSVAKAANQVGSAIAKVATSGMDKNTKMVLKNMGKIKQSIGSFIKKSAPHKTIPQSAIIPLVGRKCG
jgi:hypothetical protein